MTLSSNGELANIMGELTDRERRPAGPSRRRVFSIPLQPRRPAALIVPDAAATVQHQHRRERAGAGGPPQSGRGAAVGSAERFGVEAERLIVRGNRARRGEDAEQDENDSRESGHFAFRL